MDGEERGETACEEGYKGLIQKGYHRFHTQLQGALLTNNTQDPEELEDLQHQLIAAVMHHNDMAKNLTVSAGF